MATVPNTKFIVFKTNTHNSPVSYPLTAITSPPDTELVIKRN